MTHFKIEKVICLITQGFENFLENNHTISGFNVPSHAFLSDKG